MGYRVVLAAFTLISAFAPAQAATITYAANLPPFDIGIFDAFALVHNASLSGTFSVSFVFLGVGTPGSQLYEIFDAQGLAESGITSVPPGEMPEPSTTALFLIGLVACAIQTRRRTLNRR